jgi:hypothetical protein
MVWEFCFCASTNLLIGEVQVQTLDFLNVFKVPNENLRPVHLLIFHRSWNHQAESGI